MGLQANLEVVTIAAEYVAYYLPQDGRILIAETEQLYSYDLAGAWTPIRDNRGKITAVGVLVPLDWEGWIQRGQGRPLPPGWVWRLRDRQLGTLGEGRVARWLAGRGWAVWGMPSRIQTLGIDLVARRPGKLHAQERCLEVKTDRLAVRTGRVFFERFRPLRVEER